MVISPTFSAPLLRHPDSPVSPITDVTVHAYRDGDALVATFTLSGDLGAVAWPEPAAAERRDLLWQHTVVEAFVSAPGRTDYVEFNVSPSSAWAAYTFTEHRGGMADAMLASDPTLAVTRTAGTWTGSVRLPVPAGFGDWDVSLTAIVRDVAGQETFWATAHGAGAADFHARETFVVSFPG